MTSFCVAKLLSIITNTKIIKSTIIFINIKFKSNLLKNKNKIALKTKDENTNKISICLLNI